MSELHKKHSKFLSLILRHKPEELNLTMDDNGWVSVSDLITNSKNAKYKFNIGILTDIINTDNKGRYEFNDNKTKIRARQGHSIESVVMDFKEESPPDILYHGTSKTNYKRIIESGEIKSMNRNVVHLSDNIETASQVGKRHGELKIITIDTKAMFNDGIKFNISNNNVWMVESVPTKYFIHNEETHEQI